MTMVDNREGFGAMLAVSGAAEYQGVTVMVNDNHIYGESETTDCPSDGSYCFTFNKNGFLISGVARKGKDLHPTGSSSLPMNKIKGDGAWGGMQRFYRNKFYNFDAKTR